MTNQKAKYELIRRLESLGFSYEEACQIRRIEMTLHRWAELECGDGNNYRSWCIERDETTGKPFMGIYPNEGKSWRYSIADRERGALKRLDKIMAQHEARRTAAGAIGEALMPELTYYHQGDPRGCALYILRKTDLKPGDQLDSVYTRGMAVG